MAILLMVVLIGVMLSGLLVPMIIQQDRTTRFDKSRVHALDAAQAGIDVTLGQIRSTVDPVSGYVDNTKLPCTGSSAIIGRVSSVGAAAYSVLIDYFVKDPVKNPGLAAMVCVPRYGTYQAGTATPSYVQLTSTGTDGAAVNGSSAGRTLVTTYVIKTSDAAIGGVIKIVPNGTASLCMDVGSSAPAVGATIVLQPCSTTSAPAAQQVFTYQPNLTLQVASSVTATSPGLCLAASDPPAAPNAITLAACADPPGSPPYQQQWSLNYWGEFQASLTNSVATGVLSNLCMSTAAQANGALVKLATCVAATNGSQQWQPAASVGVGAAVSPQWVNYFDYAHCIDLPGANVSATHLIDYPCQSNPSPSGVGWNEKVTSPTITAGQPSAVGPMYLTRSSDGNKYCLTSPGTDGGLVTVSPCVSGQANQTWTVYGADKTLRYSMKYNAVDGSGRCLGLTTPVSGESWAAIATEKCTGATEQKWNANPNLGTSTQQNTTEK